MQLSRQIDTLTSCETKKQGKRNGEVTVVIMTKEATNIELKLNYRTFSLVFDLSKSEAEFLFFRLTALSSCPKRDMVCGV